MANAKRYTDEDIINAVVTSPTKQAAADKIGISRRQLFERLQEFPIQAAIRAYRLDLLQSRLKALEDAQVQAIATITAIMQNDEASNTDRLRAASLILDHGRAARQEITQADENAIGKLRSAEQSEMSRKNEHLFMF